MSNLSDFIIENGVLKKYVGSGGNVTIPNGVKSIGRMAFGNCENVINIVIPVGVECIEEEAFFCCKKLTTVKIPNTILSIGDHAFYQCKSLEQVWIPNSVAKIGGYVFCGCSCFVHFRHWTEDFAQAVQECDSIRIHTEDSLKEIPVKYRKQALLGFAAAKEDDYESERAKTYLDYAKKNVIKLCTIALNCPELLQLLCEQKLIKAKDLEYFIAEAEKDNNPDNKAILLNYQNQIGEATVSKARKKKESTEEKNIAAVAKRMESRSAKEGIDGLVFAITGKLSSLWESRKATQKYLENYGAKLASGVTKNVDYLVTDDTESGSEKNKKAKELGIEILSETDFNNLVGRQYKDAEVIQIPTWVKSIPAYAFKNCKRLKELVIPEYIATIGEGAFFGCESLTKIDIPKGISSIEPSTFCGCRSLQNFVIPCSVTSIGEDAFRSCTSLTSFTVPETITRINARTFSDCDNLIEVKLPNILTHIGVGAFRGCSNLGKIVIPESVKKIEWDAFAKCKKLKDVKLLGNESKISSSAFSGCPELSTPEGLIILNRTLVAYDGNSDDLVVPDVVKYIGDSVFAGNDSIKKLIIPDGVEKIGYGMCRDCNNLKSIIIPGTVKIIADNAFEGCKKLETVLISEGVLAVGEQAFRDCKALKSVVFPAGLEKIGYGSFYECSKLEKIEVPESLIDISSAVFTRTAFFKDDKNWDNDVLYLAGNLILARDSLSGSYHIKDGTRLIAGGAFYGCEKITEVIIPDSVEYIGDWAFHGCNNMVNVTIPDNLRNFGEGVFLRCKKLANNKGMVIFRGVLHDYVGEEEKIVIPNEVYCIGPEAFVKNATIKTVTIPDNVKTIKSFAFESCGNLADVYISKSVESIENCVFKNCPNITIHALAGSYAEQYAKENNIPFVAE